MAVPVDLFLQVLRSAHHRLQSGEVMLAVVRNLPVRELTSAVKKLAHHDD